MPLEADVPESGYAESTFWLVTQEPLLHEFVWKLKAKKNQLLEAGLVGQRIEFSRSQIQDVRAAFDRMICKGEEKLHRLCGLLSDEFFPRSPQLMSVVIAELPACSQRFKLIQDLQKQDIYARTDLDLGNWLMEKLRYQTVQGWERPRLIANFVEYQPRERNRFGINKMISRIKAEEEIWAKVVDEIFGLDQLVKQDKQLRELSYFIKDVFGIKVVVDTRQDVEAVLGYLQGLTFTGEKLSAHGVPTDQHTSALQILEVKNHLGEQEQKESGWQAVKAVVSWWNKTFEIQVQTLDIYLREQERLTHESHAAFKEKRERIRQQVADQIPLFGFYLQLMRWLFISPSDLPPSLEGLEIAWTE